MTTNTKAKATTLRNAVWELALSYYREGDRDMAVKISNLFAALPDESAVKFLDILQESFRD